MALLKGSRLDSFFCVVRLGLRKPCYRRDFSLRQTSLEDLNAIKALADLQGLSSIVVDGLEMLQKEISLPKEVLLQWIGETLRGYEYRYELYRRAIAELAEWYNSHGFKMMVLKGYACSVNWPKPEHRPSGDIDIWLFGQQKDADALLAKEKQVKIDNSHHHHSLFNWRGFSVENHYDFVNVHTRKSNKEMEVIFKKLGSDDSFYDEVFGERVYLPSPNLHALFLIRHLVSHFTSSEITLRQVLDWAFFVEKHTKEVDWDWLLPLLDQYHMKEFFNCINAICVEDLGFIPNIFPCVQFSPSLKEKVLADIIEPVFRAEEPNGFFRRVLYKYRRWQGNAWKQRLCYNDSRWSMFWLGVWSKLIKPASL